MNFGTISNEIAKIVKEDYLKQYFKVSKIFQILVTGYNASRYKTLQVFRQHGWKVHPEPLPSDEIMIFEFEYYESSMKMDVIFYMNKNLKTGVLYDDVFEAEKGYICINVDQTSKLFKLIRQLVNITNFESIRYNDCGKLIYVYDIVTKNDGSYMLQFSYPKY